MKICSRCQELYPDHVVRCPRDAEELRRVHDPLLGRTIGGRYRLISRLGSGGMSSVYLSRHVMIDRLMAIKILRRDLARDPVQRDRFIREARAVNRINHPNIVEITDFGETDDGLVYLVMEYVPGDLLLAAMADGPMDVERAFNIARQCATALARAHEMGVVHRDLKPENILLVPRREHPDFVKVLDFGIAKILDAPSLTGSQQIFGTPGYIAPEYIQSTNIDGRADIYSLGIILYELITGALPFDYEYPGDLLVKHVTDPPIPPRERNPNVAPVVEELLLRCLEKDPNDRFRDAFHFLEELDRVWELVGTPASWGGLDENSEGGVGWGAEFEQDGSVARQTLLDMEAVAPVPASPADSAPDPDLTPQLAGERAAVLDVPDPLPAAGAASPGATVPFVPGDGPGLDLAPPESPRRGPRVTIAYTRPPIPASPAVVDATIPEELRGPTPAEGVPTVRDSSRDGLLGVRRWRERYSAIRACLDEVETEIPSPPRVMQAMAVVVRGLDSLEPELDEVEVMQARLEELDGQARDFRSTLGRAIDSLAARLSSCRGEFEELVVRRNQLRSLQEGMRQKVRRGEGKEGPADAVLWELAAIEEKVAAEAARCDDLEARLGELRTELEGRSAGVERGAASTVQELDHRIGGLEDQAHALREPLATVERYLEDVWPDDGASSPEAS